MGDAPSWLRRTLPRVQNSWREFAPKPQSPPVLEAWADDTRAESLFLLGKPASPPLREKPPKAPIGLPPVKLAIARLPDETPPRPGEMRLSLLPLSLLSGDAPPACALVVDFSPEPIEPFEVAEFPEAPFQGKVRVEKSERQGGYQWPRSVRSKLDECRRQMLQRTDLSRVTYPWIPHPGELMAPMLDDDGQATRPKFEAPPRVGLVPSDIKWERVMLEIIGPLPAPEFHYKNPMKPGKKPPLRVRPEKRGGSP